MKLPISLAALFIFSFLTTIKGSQETPDMVVVMTRHGAREALNNEFGPAWKNPGYLIDAGVRQHYTMGTILGRKYAKLLENIDPTEVFLKSSARSRTTMSVSAEILGLFRNRTKDLKRRDFEVPFRDQKLVSEVIEDIMGNPEDVPNKLMIMTQEIVPMEQEDLVAYGPWNCKLLSDEQEKRLNDKPSEDMMHSFDETLNALKSHGYTIKTGEDFRNFGGDIQSRFYNNDPHYEGVPYGSKLYNDSAFYFTWYNMYNYVGSETERAVRVFPLYSRLMKWFDGKISGKNPLKFALLGGHETSLFPFLDLHKITNYTCFHKNYMASAAGKSLPFPDCTPPDFASQMTFEFYKNSGNPFIRMLFDGKPFRLCVGSEGIDCPLSQFKKEFKTLTNGMTEDYENSVCSLDSTTIIGVVISKSILSYILPIMTCLIGYLIGLSPYPSLLGKMIRNRKNRGKHVKFGDNEVSPKDFNDKNRIQISTEDPSEVGQDSDHQV